MYLMICYISASLKGNMFPGETMQFTDFKIKKASIRKTIFFLLKNGGNTSHFLGQHQSFLSY